VFLEVPVLLQGCLAADLQLLLIFAFCFSSVILAATLLKLLQLSKPVFGFRSFTNDMSEF
jgi:hypothetical protein